MPSWPSTLPWPPNGNDGKWRETPPDTAVRDKNETGPDNVRNRAMANVRKLSLPFRLKPEEVDIFDAWFNNDLQRGTLSFDLQWPPPPRATQTVTARLVCPPPPTYEHRGAGVYDVTLEVEILP